jgi:hypothetical protein
MLERMPPAGFIAYTRRQLLRAGYDLFRLGDAGAFDQERPEPIPRLQRQPRKDAPFGLVPDPPRPPPGLIQPPHPPQGTRTGEQRREVGLLVEAPGDRRAILRRPQHHCGVILLKRGLVFDPQSLQIKSAHRLAGLEQAQCPLAGIARERPPEVLTAIAPQIERRLLDVEFQVEEIVAGERPPGALQVRA